MRIRANFNLGLFVGICALVLCIHFAIPVHPALTYGDQPGSPQNSSATSEQVQENGVKTSHVDLGDGLELSEYVKSDNGVVVLRGSRATRDGKMVMTTWSSVEQGKGIRGYFHNDKMLMSEMLGKNGEIEMLILCGNSGMPVEMFEREKEGTTVPLSSKRLEEFKRKADIASEVFAPIVEAARKHSDPAKTRGLVGEALENAKKATEQPSSDDKDSP